MTIFIENLFRVFGDYVALDNINLEIQEGEFLALLGPSGSGKTSLLRMIAGLDFPDRGCIRFDGEDVTDLPASKREIGFVFQQYALFRHMTVAQNIAFGLKVRSRRLRPSKRDINSRVENLLDFVQLEDFGARYPSQLSGGQRQRVALARALAIEPRVLLLDEPFGALDTKVRKDLRNWLRALHDSSGITTVFVTHDQEEALEVADRVVIMNEGKVVQTGKPYELYQAPQTAFVCSFLGKTNCFSAVVKNGLLFFAGIQAQAPDYISSGTATVFVRSYEFRLPGDEEDGLMIPVTVESVLPADERWRVDCVTDDGYQIEAIVSDLGPEVGSGDRLFLTPLCFRIYQDK